MSEEYGAGGESLSHSSVSARCGFSLLRSLKRDLLGEQQAGWDEGRAQAPDELLARWPIDPKGDPDAASVLVEDFLQRRLRGEDPSVEEYSARYPEHEKSLAGLLSIGNAVRSVGGASSERGMLLRLPDVGDALFGFRLILRLGRGAFARVYLAEQDVLARRPVVL